MSEFKNNDECCYQTAPSKSKRRRKRRKNHKNNNNNNNNNANNNNMNTNVTISPIHNYVDHHAAISHSIFDPIKNHKLYAPDFMLNPSNHLKPGNCNLNYAYTDSECSAHTNSPSFGSLSYSHCRTPLYSTHSPSFSAAEHNNMMMMNELFIEDVHFLNNQIEIGSKYILNSQARVKADKDLSSEFITDLPSGSLIEIECKMGDRLKICTPIRGWISLRSMKNGQIIISKASKADEMEWEIRLESIDLMPHQPPNWVFDLFFADYPNVAMEEEEEDDGDADEEWNEWSKELKTAEMIYQRALQANM